MGGQGGDPRDRELRHVGYQLDLDESDRQLVLLSLAVLSLRSPGLDDALNRIAVKIDNVKGERAVMYDDFRTYRRDVDGPAAPVLNKTGGSGCQRCRGAGPLCDHGLCSNCTAIDPCRTADERNAVAPELNKSGGSDVHDAVSCRVPSGCSPIGTRWTCPDCGRGWKLTTISERNAFTQRLYEVPTWIQSDARD